MCESGEEDLRDEAEAVLERGGVRGSRNELESVESFDEPFLGYSVPLETLTLTIFLDFPKTSWMRSHDSRSTPTKFA
jgi:hypothetical protein